MTPRKIADLVVRMAVENPRCGYTRIRGALANLGHEVARNTVKRILRDQGIEPAPERSRRTPWKTFLQAHWVGLAAADFFTVEVLTLAGLKRYLVFFVIELRTRRVHIAGIHPQPGGVWVEQMARNLTDPVDGFLRAARNLIHDRDPLYTRGFAEILAARGESPAAFERRCIPPACVAPRSNTAGILPRRALADGRITTLGATRDFHHGLLGGGGVQPIRLPPKSPNLNAYAERFVRSIKEECLHRVVPLGERHLRLLAREYLEHYHRGRNHQGLDNRHCQVEGAGGTVDG